MAQTYRCAGNDEQDQQNPAADRMRINHLLRGASDGGKQPSVADVSMMNE